MSNKYKATFAKSKLDRTGSGHITWTQFSAMLRACGILYDGQHLGIVEVDSGGITFTTAKTGKVG